MPKSNQSGSPWGSGPRAPPDFEEFLRRGQDRLGGLMRGNLGGRGFALIAVAAVVLWGFSGFFRVEPDELGVVLRFGKFVREAQPGLNYHLPYPIETALTPQKAPDVTRKRIYLETMERVLGGTDKTIIDIGGQSSPGVVPYLPLNSLPRERPTQQSQSGGNQ